MGALTLATERLELVPFAADHVDFLHRLWITPDVRRFLWDDRVIDRAEAVAVVEASRASFASQGFGFWVVHDKASGEAVGFAGLRELDDQSHDVELLYGLAPAWWGRGLATEASRAVLAHAFATCDLPRVYAGADPPNTASLRVMERLGMRFAERRIVHGLEAVYYVLERAAPGATHG